MAIWNFVQYIEIGIALFLETQSKYGIISNNSNIAKGEERIISKSINNYKIILLLSTKVTFEITAQA